MASVLQNRGAFPKRLRKSLGGQILDDSCIIHIVNKKVKKLQTGGSKWIFTY